MYSCEQVAELQPQYYGLSDSDTVKPFGLLQSPELEVETEVSVKELHERLQQIYCGDGASLEFSYIEVSLFLAVQLMNYNFISILIRI